MRKILFATILLFSLSTVQAQNVGIGNTSPAMKLHVTNNDSSLLILENSNSLAANVTSAVYLKAGAYYTAALKSRGVSSNTASLGIYTYASGAASGLKERVTITDAGLVGIGYNAPVNQLEVNGRITVRHNVNTAGIWYNKSDNSFSNFMGNYNDTITGVYTATGSGWQYFFDHKNARVGIRNASPQAPLSFENAIGNKISLWGNASGAHYGMGIQGSLLQLYTDGTGSDIAFGYGNSGTFTENVRITGDGKVGVGTNAPTEKMEIVTGQGAIGWKHSYGTGNSISCRAGSFFLFGATPATINSTGYALKINQGTNDGILLTTDGKILMGPILTGASGYLLNVAGKVIAEEVRVQLNAAWPDYVFADNYNLRPLSEVEQYIKQNKHLPEFKKATEIEKEGADLGETQRKLVEKVEELTLYVIELNKQIEELKKKVKL